MINKSVNILIYACHDSSKGRTSTLDVYRSRIWPLRSLTSGLKEASRNYCYSACVSLYADADADIAGAPASPLDVKCLDANKDYVIISWKQPAVDGGSPILGYFIDKLVFILDSIYLFIDSLPSYWESMYSTQH